MGTTLPRVTSGLRPLGLKGSAVPWRVVVLFTVSALLSAILLWARFFAAPVAQRLELEVDGIPRSFLVQWPVGQPPAAGWPVVFSLHSWGDDAKDQAEADGLRLRGLVRALVLHPEGYGLSTRGSRDASSWNSWHGSGSAGANADGGLGGPICEPEAVPDGDWKCYPSCEKRGYCTPNGGGLNKCRWTHCEDDVAFMLAMLDYLKQRTAVDPANIFAVGYSNGGMLTFELASDPRSEGIFAAIVAVGALPHVGFNRGTRSPSMRLLVIMGTADSYVVAEPNVPSDPTESFSSVHGWFYSSYINTTRLWASQRGMSGEENKTLIARRTELVCEGWSSHTSVDHAQIATCFYDGDHTEVPCAAWATAWDFFGAASLDDWTTGYRMQCPDDDTGYAPPYLSLFGKLAYIAGVTAPILLLLMMQALKDKLPALDKNGADSNHESPTDSLSPKSTGPLAQYPKITVIQQFQEIARDAPTRVALVYTVAGRRSEATYGEYDAIVRRVAGQLTALGLEPGHIVALLVDRGLHQIVSLYAVMCCGAAWVPLDASTPASRVQEVLEDSGANLFFYQEGFPLPALNYPMPVATISFDADSVRSAGELVHAAERMSGLPGAAMTDMAVVFYTSGSSGKPKGVIYSHAHVNHEANNFGDATEMSPESRGICKSPYVWAGIVWEAFSPLTRGARVVIASAQGHKDASYLANLINDEGVTIAFFPPKLLEMLLDSHAAGSQLGHMEHIVAIGEALPVQLANRFASMPYLSARLHNCYAATESSTTIYTVPLRGVNPGVHGSRVPVGIPQPGGAVHVLDSERQRVAPGQPGELCFGGQLSDGYLKNPQMTAEKFVETKQFGRIYCSGDMGRWHHGQLEVLGRADRQIKIRGVRIEPEDIEVALRRYEEDGVQVLHEVAVVATPVEPVELVAFITPFCTEERLARVEVHCKASLPPYYVPKYFFVLDKLPTLVSGKTNLRELVQRAATEVNKGEAVLDSLGLMQSMSKDALLETQVIHRCYAIWMLCVVVGHWNGCAEDPYRHSCAALTQPGAVPAWVEMFFRQMGGGDQTMFGFLMLGALQDSQPKPGQATPKVSLGKRDWYMYFIFLAMAFPIPQLLYAVFGPAFVAEGLDEIWPGWNAAHRWYLWMVLWARVCLRLGQGLHVPAWAQVSLQAALAVFGPAQALDPCVPSVSRKLQWLLGWLMAPYQVYNDHDGGCAIYWSWLQYYLVIYLASFHYIRPCLKWFRRVASACCDGPSWSIVALFGYVAVSGVLTAFHYPDIALNYDSTDPEFHWYWLPVEVVANVAQAILLPLAMVWLPYDLRWWGGTTLGTYVFHFYWRDDHWVWLARILAQLPFHGVVQLATLLGVAVAYVSVLGPIGHRILLWPMHAADLVKQYSRRLPRRRSGSLGEMLISP